MKPPRKTDRREFTVEAALALLSGVTITIWGCGDGDSPSPTEPTGMTPSPSPSPQPTPPTPGSDVMGVVGSNHGHVAVIEAAELEAGGALTIDIRGDADHPHTVMLTADEVDRIAAGMQVAATSSVDFAHAHTVTFN